ncbi:uncharacterized protein [Drosophila tropicalis]|uniref:uncharacterized protein n=1 Tax=Drosophila tropicalis TaxID=46794 RepID=UPI0035AC20FC
MEDEESAIRRSVSPTPIANNTNESPSSSSCSLNVLCGICNEFYRPNDIIFSTYCGHVFHKDCLNRWLYRSQTCPQCRSNCHRNRIHRVFLNFSERTEVDFEEPPKQFIQWLPMDLDVQAPRNSHLPPEGAVKSGTDDSGNETYVARVYLHEDLLPGGYAPLKKAIQAPWNCRGHTLTDEVEILILTDCDYSWEPGANGAVPANSLNAGYSELGEGLYTARGIHEGLTLLGKVHPSHRVMYMPYRGQEVSSRTYEVLTVRPREQAER